MLGCCHQGLHWQAHLRQGFLKVSQLLWGFPDSSVGKESSCNAEDPCLIPGSGRSPGEEIGYPLQYSWPRTLPKTIVVTCLITPTTFCYLKTILSFLILKLLSAVLLPLHPLTFYSLLLHVPIVNWLLTLSHKLLENKAHGLWMHWNNFWHLAGVS